MQSHYERASQIPVSRYCVSQTKGLVDSSGLCSLIFRRKRFTGEFTTAARPTIIGFVLSLISSNVTLILHR